MSTPNHVVVVGGGLAGAKSAEALRGQGFTGQVSVLSAESHPPYERPPLSKDYLAGSAAFDDALVQPIEWYRDNDVDLHLGSRATAVDAAAHEVHRADGTTLGYDKLVLATGSIPRWLPLPGADAAGVYTLRTREDADAIRAHFGDGKHLVVIGGGWIGLEVAATARSAGTGVTVLEAAELPLLGVLGPEMGRVFAALHRDHGVDLRLGAQVAEITAAGGVATGVRLADGTVIGSNAVVVGIGVTPDLAVAESAGLALDNGVLVDSALRTSDPDVYAVGDIANHDHPVLGHRVRVEHWATALNQPASAVAALLGQDTVYTELPFFFSDQYDLGLEYIGHAPPGSHDRLVVHGDLDAREFVAFWLRDERILAAMNVNVWDVVDKVKPLITDRTRVDPARLEKLGADL